MTALTHYIELSVLPDGDISTGFLMRKIYPQLHLALVEHYRNHPDTPVGFGFPDYKAEKKKDKTVTSLGNRIRIFSTAEEVLQKLNLSKWLEQYSDYVHLKSIQKLNPDSVKAHQIFQRQSRKPENPRLTARFARRKGIENLEEARQQQVEAYAQRHKISPEAAASQYQQARERETVPFVPMKSLSNGKSFNLSVEQKPAEAAVSGPFTSYGLSLNGTTVPHW